MFTLSDALLLIGLAIFVVASIVGAIRDMGPVERDRRDRSGLQTWVVLGLLVTGAAFGWKAVLWTLEFLGP